MKTTPTDKKAPVAISQCLVGDKVRYNGKDKYDPQLLLSLDNRLQLHAICPEVSIGLGVPRAPIQLVNIQNSIFLKKASDPRVDLTASMQAQAMVDSQRLSSLCGYIVMHGSPSCGLDDVKRFDINGNLQDEAGQGIYIAAIKKQLPWLPIETATALHDNKRLDNFLTRVFTLYDWHQSVAQQPSAKQLIAFHSRYKYLLMTHNAYAYRQLGKMLANLATRDLSQLAHEYILALLLALQKHTARGGYTNVLLHLKGYFRAVFSAQEHRAFDALVTSYQAGHVALSEPRTYLYERVARTGDNYLAAQVWWQPYPAADVLQDAVDNRNFLETP